MLKILMAISLFANAQSLETIWDESFQISKKQVSPSFQIEAEKGSGPYLLDVKLRNEKANVGVKLNGKSVKDFKPNELNNLNLQTSNLLSFHLKNAKDVFVDARIIDLGRMEEFWSREFKGDKKSKEFKINIEAPTEGSYVLEVVGEKGRQPNIFINGTKVKAGPNCSGRNHTTVLHTVANLQPKNVLKVKGLSKGQALTVRLYKNQGPEFSIGQLEIENAEGNVLNPTPETLNLRLEGQTFDTDPERTWIRINNDTLERSDFNVSSSSVAIVNGLKNGFNDIEIESVDSSGDQILFNTILWFGSHQLTVEVRDEGGEIVDSGSVLLRTLGPEPVEVNATILDGRAVFRNVPNGNVLFVAEDTFGKRGAKMLGIGSSQTVKVTIGVGEPIFESNNGIGFRTQQATGAPAPVMGKVPLNITLQAPPVEDHPFYDPETGLTEFRKFFSGTFKEILPLPPAVRTVAINGTVTKGVDQGPTGPMVYFDATFQRLDGSHISINPPPRVTMDRADGKLFVSGLVPPGAAYIRIFGYIARYDVDPDFVVTLNELSYSALSVTFDVYDLTSSKRHWPSEKFQPLRMVSVDPAMSVPKQNSTLVKRNSEFGGSITATLAEGDQVTSVEFRLYGAEQSEANGQVTPFFVESMGLQAGNFFAVDSRFGGLEGLPLFEVTPTQAARIPRSTSERNHLQIAATVRTRAGEELTAVYRIDRSRTRFPVLRFLGDDITRYNEIRDYDVGGDSWARPRVIDRTIAIANRVDEMDPDLEFEINDLSDMHGGRFPPHISHDRGTSVDCRIADFPLLNGERDPDPGAAAGEALARFINTLSNNDMSEIQAIYVTFQQNSPFIVSLQENLDNPNRARRVVNKPGHKNHFHIEYRRHQGDYPR